MKKPWPYWLKGALLFGVLFLPIFWGEGIAWLFPPLTIIWYVLGFQYTSTLAFFIAHGSDPAGELTSSHRFLGLCILVIMYILIGGILGWIYGRIKNGKKLLLL